MNFSDETVEKVKKKIALEMYGVDEFADIDENEREQCLGMAIIYAKAALSSLTLADLMQVNEVRELVDAAQNTVKTISDKVLAGNPTKWLVTWEDVEKLRNKLTPFTEIKEK